ARAPPRGPPPPPPLAVAVFLSMMSYLVDAYLALAASALAANAVIRSLAGFAFPLFTKAMFEGMGTQWALTLIAIISLVLAPIPFVFYYYGAHIRRNSTFAPGHRPAAPAAATTPSVEADAAEELDLGEAEDHSEERQKERREGVLDEGAAAEAERRGE
ncbi:hypothetical protein JCM3770_005548, partial [Rhodotorula araucariae]